MRNRFRKLLAILQMIREKHLPLIPTLILVARNLLTKKVSLSVMARTPYLTHPEEPLIWENIPLQMKDYVDRVIRMNDLSLRPLVLDKANMFIRLKDAMGREALRPAGASDEEINAFLRRWDTIVGKQNLSGGKGFHIYSAERGDSAETIRADDPDVLEPFIHQHLAISRIHPSSVNTLRIHTVRNSQGARLFFLPKLRIGAKGSLIDISDPAISYRLLLTGKGRIIRGFQCDPARSSFAFRERQEDTGYRFRPGRKLPCIPAAIDLCLRLAPLLPEIRYVGWDIAITDHGPIIVEVNDVSGFWRTYQALNEMIDGVAPRYEVEEMLAYGMEGIRFGESPVFFSEPFVRIHPEFPSIRELYLIYLQTALHRHGVFFHDLDEGEKRALPGWRDCILCRDEESGGIRIELDDVSEIQPLQWQEALPEGKWNPDDSALTLPQELFCALDRKAMHQAALIYQTLVLGSTRPRSKEGLAAYANFCCRLNTAYLWSGMGQLMSREVLDHVQSFYPGHYSTKKIKRFASLIGSNTYVFDCSGLIKSYYFGGLGAPEYEESRDWNSNMLFERAVRKGPLSSLPEEPGLCVYKKNHVGVYLHGGWVVESSPKPGELGGVHLSALDEGDWESWFACPL